MDSSTSLDDISISVGRADDFVVISKPKIGVALIEARLKEGFEHTTGDKGFQQLKARLERELNSPLAEDDAVLSLGADLLRDPTFHGRFPPKMFGSVEVVEFQGFDTETGLVKARDVELRVVVYGDVERRPLKPKYEVWSKSSRDIIDGIWELC